MTMSEFLLVLCFVPRRREAGTEYRIKFTRPKTTLMMILDRPPTNNGEMTQQHSSCSWKELATKMDQIADRHRLLEASIRNIRGWARRRAANAIASDAVVGTSISALQTPHDVDANVTRATQYIHEVLDAAGDFRLSGVVHRHIEYSFKDLARGHGLYDPRLS